MAVYEYECIHCRKPFEVRASIQAKIAGLTPRCPECGTEDVRQKLTAPSLVRTGSGLSGAGCGPNSGPGCCR